MNKQNLSEKIIEFEDCGRYYLEVYDVKESINLLNKRIEEMHEQTGVKLKINDIFGNRLLGEEK